ncbi:hypothetical protein G9A89_023015 [Geosiphon pyriformis]|nr:hypothetical protein G9A89_023015 [Geosiphon pyriformis]
MDVYTSDILFIVFGIVKICLSKKWVKANLAKPIHRFNASEGGYLPSSGVRHGFPLHFFVPAFSSVARSSPSLHAADEDCVDVKNILEELAPVRGRIAEPITVSKGNAPWFDRSSRVLSHLKLTSEPIFLMSPYARVSSAKQKKDISQKTPSLDFTLDHSKFLDSACYIVLNFFPEWERKDMKLVEKKGGLTNKRNRNTICESKILVRVFGKNSELLIDREQELRVSFLPGKHGFFFDHISPYLTIIDIIEPLEIRIITTRLVEKKGGLTNKRNRNTICESKILVRVFGKNSELLIDREQELRTLLSLSKLGLSPPVYGRFQNGIVYGCIPGEHLLLSDFSDFKKSALVARQLALLHSTEVAGPNNVVIWGIIKKWLNQRDPKDTERFAKHYKLSDLKQEATSLQTALEKVRSPIVFCHNDLLPLNIIFNKSEEKISFIDYEYEYYNYRGYDIATFFSVSTGEFQLREYPDQSEPGRQITPNELEQMYAEVNKFALILLFHRGLWCLVFVTLFIEALDLYFLIRDEVLML